MRLKRQLQMQRPVLNDAVVWQHQLLEHRRNLLELVIKEFPQVLKTHRTAIDLLRLKMHNAITKGYTHS